MKSAVLQSHVVVMFIISSISMKNGKCKLTSKCLAAFSLDLLYLFFCSSATLSTLTCQVSYKLAFQSQTPRAESPDQTFLWKFLLEQLGKSQQNKQIFCVQTEFLVTYLLAPLYVSEFTQVSNLSDFNDPVTTHRLPTLQTHVE